MVPAIAPLALIGGGAMGSALIAGMIDDGLLDAAEIVVAEPDPDRARSVADTTGARVVSDAGTAVISARTVVLAIKQGPLDEVCAAIGPALAPEAVVVSIIAGVSTAALERRLPAGTAVVRAMPNTPALVGAGMSAITAGSAADAEAMAVAERLLGAVGDVMAVPEDKIDAVTAVSGSGPAYFFLVAEAMIEAATAMGLSSEEAARLVRRTLAGSGALLESPDRTPAELRTQVTSPGGTTAAALSVLESRDLRGGLFYAIEAATRRSEELGQQFA